LQVSSIVAVAKGKFLRRTYKALFWKVNDLREHDNGKIILPSTAISDVEVQKQARGIMAFV